MATIDGDSAAALASRPATPIAQLNPGLSDQASRVVRGEVTITWPYNSVTRKFAFLLAEPDVRLRRAKGQIRVELQGPSAKAASDCGLGAGDELLFSLAGAEWNEDPSPGRIPGARVEWQLQFNQKLVLQVKFGESGDIKHLTVDHPAAAQTDGPVTKAPRVATPEPEPIPPQIPTTGRKISELTADEYPSPAFVKRARLSYGALFEGGFDIFEEDGGIKGRGRKRTRFGRDSSAWRYSSHSPSPEPTSPVVDAMDEDSLENMMPQPSPKPQTMDEGCQTVEVEMAQAPEEPIAHTIQEKTPTPPETPTPVPRGLAAAHAPMEETPVHQTQRPSVAPISREEPAPAVHKENVAMDEESSSVIYSTRAVSPLRHSPGPPVEREQPQEQSFTTVTQPTALLSNDTEAAQNTLFGPKSFASSFSSFGGGAPSRVESSLSLADQVRFGFSHVPQTTRSPSPPKPEPAPDSVHHHQEPYPMAYLDVAPASVKYADMDSYLNAGNEQDEMAVHGQSMPPEPPTVESFGDGQWDVSTQSPHYNLVEGGHFGADALDEGARVIAQEPSLHADDISPDRVPEGFASYGNENVLEMPHGSPPLQAPPHEDQPYVENEDTISDDEVSVGEEEEEDEDEKFDKYAYGERIEEGDYDQRNYDIPSDDEEGLSEEDEEDELEAEERYGNAETYDEDGEGEEWDEEDEDYESDEEDYEEEDHDVGGYQSRRPAAPAPSREPVVISLLSDSEDEDEPTPPPRKPAPAPEPAHEPEPSTRSESTPSTKPDELPGVLQTVETDSAAMEASNNILSQTHIVDFAMRDSHNISQQPRAPPAEMGRDTGSPPFASQVAGSFDLSSARDESYARVPEPAAPSEGSSGLFVPQSKPESTPSESSSEGLFIAQPRARSPSAEDERTDAGSAKEGEQESVEGSLSELEETNEASVSELEDADASSTNEAGVAEEVDENFTNEPEAVDEGSTDEPEVVDETSANGGVDLEPEQSSARDKATVDEMEQDDIAPSPEAQYDDASLPDAEDLSFTSQVEMPEEFGESEDEHMSVDDDVPSRPADTVDTQDAVMSTFEVEDAIDSEDDVDMIDAGSVPAESASPEQMASSPRQENSGDASTAVSDLVVTEITSEAVSITPAQEHLPDIQAEMEPEQQAPSPTVGDRELASTELPQGIAENMSNGQLESFAAKAEVHEEPSDPGSVSPSTAGLRSQVDFATQEAPKSAQELLTQALDETEHAISLPAEPVREADEALPVNREAIDGASRTIPSAVDTTIGAEPDGATDVNTPAQRPTVTTLGGTTPEDQPNVLSPQAEQDEEEEVVSEAEASTQQVEEPETAQQPRSPTAEDLEDEAMLLEQLTQEQQQSFEADTAESQGRLRTRSPSPDLSVHLARQAVASKRHKKAPEPTRTSPRLTRARSNSFRSNTTNGTPEKDKEREQDPSVSLARAALASPSRRGIIGGSANGPSTSSSFTSTTTTATALKSDLAKRLRTELPECVPLKSLRAHLDKTPNVVAVVTSQPTKPARAKGGPREYVMSFHVTDPSAAPSTVVEVQMYRPHKDSLPLVRPGDVVLLSRFQVKAVSKKGWGLRTAGESAWAVWEGGRQQQEQQEQQGQAAGGGECPQIRGPPVEDWQGYVGYVGTLKEWFALVVGDEAARGKLERADRKLMEAK